MQRQILINVMIFFAYALNLPHTKAPSPLTTRWKTWPGFWLMAVARYIALPLISRYLSMDPTNRDISGLHCTWFCYHLIAKPGNKTAAPPWHDPAISCFLKQIQYSYGYVWWWLAEGLDILVERIQARTKWPPFCRLHFQIRFLESMFFFIQIQLKVDPSCPIDNIPSLYPHPTKLEGGYTGFTLLVQIMAWCRSGDKALSEPMMV